MKNYLFVAISAALLLACKEKSFTSIPQNIIQPDSMAALLTEVHVLQASLQLGYEKNDTVVPANTAFANLWKKHHITAGDYRRYVLFYTQNPALLDTVYEKVLNNISRQKAELQGKAAPSGKNTGR